MKNAFVFTVLILALISCGKAEEAAKKMCACSDELLKSNKDAGEAGSADELISASQRMTENFNSYAECARKIQLEYKGQVDNVAFENAMKEICPDNYKLLKELEMTQKRN